MFAAMLEQMFASVMACQLLKQKLGISFKKNVKAMPRQRWWKYWISKENFNLKRWRNLKPSIKMTTDQCCLLIKSNYSGMSIQISDSLKSFLCVPDTSFFTPKHAKNYISIINQCSSRNESKQTMRHEDIYWSKNWRDLLFLEPKENSYSVTFPRNVDMKKTTFV